MDPERMRAAVADYVTALHQAYLAQADTFPPAVRGAILAVPFPQLPESLVRGFDPPVREVEQHAFDLPHVAVRQPPVVRPHHS